MARAPRFLLLMTSWHQLKPIVTCSVWRQNSKFSIGKQKQRHYHFEIEERSCEKQQQQQKPSGGGQILYFLQLRAIFDWHVPQWMSSWKRDIFGHWWTFLQEKSHQCVNLHRRQQCLHHLKSIKQCVDQNQWTLSNLQQQQQQIRIIKFHFEQYHNHLSTIIM